MRRLIIMKYMMESSSWWWEYQVQAIVIKMCSITWRLHDTPFFNPAIKVSTVRYYCFNPSLVSHFNKWNSKLWKCCCSLDTCGLPDIFSKVGYFMCYRVSWIHWTSGLFWIFLVLPSQVNGRLLPKIYNTPNNWHT